jgi:hypothetical protein
MVSVDPQDPDELYGEAELSKWYSLDSVPKDGREVLFWVPDADDQPFEDGEIETGTYDAVLSEYLGRMGELIAPICWRELPSGPASTDDISFERDEVS